MAKRRAAEEAGAVQRPARARTRKARPPTLAASSTELVVLKEEQSAELAQLDFDVLATLAHSELAEGCQLWPHTESGLQALEAAVRRPEARAQLSAQRRAALDVHALASQAKDGMARLLPTHQARLNLMEEVFTVAERATSSEQVRLTVNMATSTSAERTKGLARIKTVLQYEQHLVKLRTAFLQCKKKYLDVRLFYVRWWMRYSASRGMLPWRAVWRHGASMDPQALALEEDHL